MLLKRSKKAQAEGQKMCKGVGRAGAQRVSRRSWGCGRANGEKSSAASWIKLENKCVVETMTS